MPGKRTITPAERAEVREILIRNGRGPADLTVADGLPIGLAPGHMQVKVQRNGQDVANFIVEGWDDNWLSHFEERLKAGAYD